jgi:hypothetical protein
VRDEHASAEYWFLFDWVDRTLVRHLQMHNIASLRLCD